MSVFDDRRLAALFRRHLTPAGNAPAHPVTLAATTLVLTFPRAEQDTKYGVAVEPSWLTTHAVTTKATTGLTVTFGTAAPANATCDVSTWRTD